MGTGIMRIANRSESFILDVVDAFGNTSDTIQELILSAKATKGVKLNEYEQTSLDKDLTIQKQKELEARLKITTENMNEKKEKAEEYRLKWEKAQAKAKEWNDKNVPLYEEEEIPIMRTVKKYKEVQKEAGIHSAK